MADLFKVAPGGLASIRPRTGGWVLIRGGLEEGVTTEFTAQPLWILNHNLGRYPSKVSIRNTGGTLCDADIRHVSVNQLRVYFDVPTAGVLEVS